MLMFLVYTLPDLKWLNPVELFQGLSLLGWVTDRQHIGSHLRYDVPREYDVVTDCVLGADRKSDDVIVIYESWYHVQLSRHVDRSE